MSYVVEVENEQRIVKTEKDKMIYAYYPSINKITKLNKEEAESLFRQFRRDGLDATMYKVIEDAKKEKRVDIKGFTLQELNTAIEDIKEAIEEIDKTNLTGYFFDVGNAKRKLLRKIAKEVSKHYTVYDYDPNRIDIDEIFALDVDVEEYTHYSYFGFSFESNQFDMFKNIQDEDREETTAEEFYQLAKSIK